jgi:Mg2+/Co2+ transporter CorB
MTGWLTISIVIALLAVSAFFAASETALTGASRGSMLRLAKQGNRDAAIVAELIANRERLIGALLLGNNIANIGASALATGILTAWFGEVGVLYATAVMTAVVVIFAEVLPKTIAINAPDRFALSVGRPCVSRPAPTSRYCRHSSACAARSTSCIAKARWRRPTATCSVDSSTCASSRSPT